MSIRAAMRSSGPSMGRGAGPSAGRGPGPSAARPSFGTVRREAGALLRSHRRTLFIGFLLMVVNRVSGLFLPSTSKVLVDEIVGKDRWDLLVPLALAAAGAALLQAGTSFALSQVVGIAAHRAITDMRRRIHAHIIRLPVAHFDRTRTGVLVSRTLTDAEGIRNLIGNGLIQLLGSLVTAVIAGGVLFYLNPGLTVATLFILILFVIGMSLAFRRLRPIFRERGALHARLTGRLTEGLSGIREVKSYVAERKEERAFAHGVHAVLRNVARSITGTSLMGVVSTGVTAVVGILILLVGGNAIREGTMTLGDVILYTFFSGLMAAPLVQVAGVGTQMTEAFAGLDRIREILSVETEDMEAGEPAGEVAGEIRFEGVSFAYDPGRPVLHDLSFHSPGGTTTALVGPSGSGKTTLIGLIATFHKPSEGRILVDGRDLSTLRLDSYRRTLGIVRQESFLFDGTVAENIGFGVLSASREEIMAAAEAAQCHDFIMELEEGYDTVVGERGVRLSGGQRQRIAIARALLSDPRILLLDEATSALDAETEARVREGLQRLRSGRTTFVIAHRFSTIRSSDQILVMEEGRIVERGTHDDLVRIPGGHYRRLHDHQLLQGGDLFIHPDDPHP